LKVSVKIDEKRSCSRFSLLWLKHATTLFLTSSQLKRQMSHLTTENFQFLETFFFNFLQKNWFLPWDFFSFLFNWFLISLSPPVTRHRTVFWTKKLTVMTKIGSAVDHSIHHPRVEGSSPALHRRGRKLKMATTLTMNYYFRVHWNVVGGVGMGEGGLGWRVPGLEVWPKHHWLHTTWLPRLLVKF